MKKLNLLYIVLILLISSWLSAQSCLPEGIYFSTQEQIDSFSFNYPVCTEIEGDVFIKGDSITNLSGLNNISSIGGELNIENNEALISLNGLYNLDSIGGNLTVRGNAVLTNLNGLYNLTSIGGGLEVSWSYALTSFNGLYNLTSIGGSLTVHLTSLNGLYNLTSIGGNVKVIYAHGLTSLNGLYNLTSIGGNLWVIGNNDLKNLSGLDNLISIGGTLMVRNTSLTDLSGLEKLTSIGGVLGVESNEDLKSLSALENLTSIGGGLIVRFNDELKSLSGLDNIDYNTITELLLESCDSLSSCEVKSVCDFIENGGPLSIYWNATGCNNVAEVQAVCEPVGVLSLNPESDYTIYPNPGSNHFTIDFGNNIQQPGSINIYNSIGQTVYSEEVQQGKSKQTLKLAHLTEGTYFLKLRIGDDQATQTLIIAH